VRRIMANSRWAYVRSFEQPDTLLPQCWVVVRVDGKGFTKCVLAWQRRWGKESHPRRTLMAGSQRLTGSQSLTTTEDCTS